MNTTLDYRLYRRLTSRSLFALRAVGAFSAGEGYSVYSMGGINQLRGYEFREFFGSHLSWVNLEFRFPLVDALAFPFGAIRNIRAFLFFDVGTAWLRADQITNAALGHKTFSHPDLGFEVPVSVNGQIDGRFIAFDPSTGNPSIRQFDFWDSKNNSLGDGRAAYGFGWNFWLGPFQLTWTFSRLLENTVEVCETTDPLNPGTAPCTLTRIDDPFRERGTVTEFYIAREF